jgi:hypothetical protein
MAELFDREHLSYSPTCKATCQYGPVIQPDRYEDANGNVVGSETSQHLAGISGRRVADWIGEVCSVTCSVNTRGA